MRGLEGSIDLAPFFESVAAATEPIESDLDVFVVGTASLLSGMKLFVLGDEIIADNDQSMDVDAEKQILVSNPFS